MVNIYNILIFILVLSGRFAQGQRSSDKPYPNVIIILADDMGYGDLSCYGAKKINTPNIDQIANQGILYTDAHSPSSVCTPSRYNLLTGRYAWRTWVKSGTVWANDPLLIDTNRLTLADLFKTHGYNTACLGKWHLGFGSSDNDDWDEVLGPNYNNRLKPGPLEVGFDYFWGFPHVGQLPHIIIENHNVTNLSESDTISLIQDPRPEYQKNYLERPRIGAARIGVNSGRSSFYQQNNLANRLIDKAVQWIDTQNKDRPFFLYLAHRNIHTPMIPDDNFVGKSKLGKRGDFIMELDYSVGVIIKELKRKNLYNNTIIIFTSDNGGVYQYKPIDYPEDKGHYINGSLRGQKTTVYEGGHRIPFIIQWPDVIKNVGKVDSSLIALTDIIATFGDFFDYTFDENTAEDSFSFLSSFLNQSKSNKPKRSILINDSYSGLFSLRRDNWKYIDGPGGGGVGEEMKNTNKGNQLYNLRMDIKEENNLSTSQTELVNELQYLLQKIQKDSRSSPLKN